MNPIHSQPPAPRHRPPGFSLIVVVILMALLSLMSLGMLSLGTISLRSSHSQQHRATARANARLSLQLALGSLQKLAGPDTRVTASSMLLHETDPPLVGVWKSWEGTDHETSGRFPGRPVAPDYATKEQPASSGSEGRFLGWLASSPRRFEGVDDASSLASRSATAGRVALLSDGTLATGDERRVYLQPTLVGGKKAGAVAWWVAGENQKARLPEPYEPDDDGVAEWSTIARSHAEADPEVFGLKRLLDHPEQAEKAVSLESANLLASERAERRPSERFHDLSVASVGLLTNVATGGWRKDLSLFCETWDSLPRSGLPVFRLTPDQTASMARPTQRDAQARSSILYPWASYRGGTGTAPIYQHGAVASWAHLRDWVTFYQQVNASSDGEATVSYRAYDINDPGNSYPFLHQVRVVPVVARIQWVFSHVTQRAGGEYELGLLVNPVITMWNPYGVNLRCNGLRFSLERNLPCAFSYKVGRADRRYRSLLTGSESQGVPALSGTPRLEYRIRQPFILGPGETQVFSAQTGQPVDVDSNIILDLRSGYRPGSGHLFHVKDNRGTNVTVGASDAIVVDARFDTPYSDYAEGVGIYLDMGPYNSSDRNLVYRMVYDRSLANQVYPPISSSSFTQPTAAEVTNTPVPFLSTIFGTRLASESQLPAKGFLQSSPLVNYTAMGSKAAAEAEINYAYPGVLHPVNSPFDYSFIQHAPGDSRLPNSSADGNEGYIISGFDKSSGLSRAVIAELPLRPICSLADLQNWDLRYENPVPPFQFDLVGNSDATPILPPDAVVSSGAPRDPKNLQHDDAYCANHLLFDDWFVSSIATRPNAFGRGGDSYEEVYENFVSGDESLDNRAYQPAARRAGSDPRDDVEDRDAWQTIASRLEVRGMFNVNSVSVEAWKALLRHARDQKMPYFSSTGVELSGSIDHAVSRFPIAGDSEAGTQGSAGAFPGSSEFGGYRRFDDDLLDELAGNIVEQVRERGPFLSLSEFINRQLSSGELALAGAVQTALNQLGTDGPYTELSRLSRNAGIDQLPRASLAGYEFPEASVGESATGLPGWTRQADILRPLAPILSARDDTFTVRAYGDARDAKGGVLATATCEAVVRRMPDFVDPADEADITDLPEEEANRTFGRRFEVVSFRWLSPREI
ncbi:hypothetical protein [Haloferula sargassicola]|uniref:Verru_Chthon cassette protein A n=1 Tax=Haloferula sargassicola TaxID=490096 RepID=A0ABP9ULD0_9BACT